MVWALASYIHSDNGPSLVSNELRTYLLSLGVPYSNSAVYNPRGNGQCERFNGTIWRSIQLAVMSKGLKDSQWEEVLPLALHSIRSLVCVSTNETPHERLFNFQRRSMTGHSLPSWLLRKGKVLLRKHTWSSKYDPLCEEVELVNITPTYAQVKHKSGLEQTVSLRDLAPLPSPQGSHSPDSGSTSTESYNPPVLDSSSPLHKTHTGEQQVTETVPIQLSIDKSVFSRNVFNNSNSQIVLLLTMLICRVIILLLMINQKLLL